MGKLLWNTYEVTMKVFWHPYKIVVHILCWWIVWIILQWPFGIFTTYYTATNIQKYLTWRRILKKIKNHFQPKNTVYISNKFKFIQWKIRKNNPSLVTHVDIKCAIFLYFIVENIESMIFDTVVKACYVGLGICRSIVYKYR